MKSIIVGLVLAFSLAFVPTAHAASNFTTAGELLEQCSATLDNRPVRLGLCYGYINGWLDDHQLYTTTVFEDGFDVGQAVRLFVLCLKNHPEDENRPAGQVMLRAMQPLIKSQ